MYVVRNVTKSIIACLTFIMVFTVISLAFLLNDGVSNALKIASDSVPCKVLIQTPKIEDMLKLNNERLFSINDTLYSLCTNLENHKEVKLVRWNMSKDVLFSDLVANAARERKEYRDYAECINNVINGVEELDNIYPKMVNRVLIERMPLMGINDTELPSGFQLSNDPGKIKTGDESSRVFNEEELKNGEFVCLVPVDSYVYNPEIESLEFGAIDKTREIHFTDYYIKAGRIRYMQTYTFKKIGTFMNHSSDFTVGDIDDTYIRPSTPVIIPEKTMMKIIDDQERLMKEYECEVFTSGWMGKNEVYDSDDAISGFNNVSKITYLESPEIEVSGKDNLAKITDYVKNKTEGIEEIKVFSTSEEFDKIAAPAKSLEKLSLIILIISAIFGTGITVLIVRLMLKDRQKEIGIYMALGESKKEIMKRILTDLVCLTVVSLTVALVLSNFIGRYAGDYIVRNNTIRTTSSQVFNLTTQTVIEQFKLCLSMKSGLIIIGLCILITGISVIVGTRNITKMDAKKVLLDGN